MTPEWRAENHEHSWGRQQHSHMVNQNLVNWSTGSAEAYLESHSSHDATVAVVKRLPNVIKQVIMDANAGLQLRRSLFIGRFGNHQSARRMGNPVEANSNVGNGGIRITDPPPLAERCSQKSGTMMGKTRATVVVDV